VAVWLFLSGPRLSLRPSSNGEEYRVIDQRNADVDFAALVQEAQNDGQDLTILSLVDPTDEELAELDGLGGTLAAAVQAGQALVPGESVRQLEVRVEQGVFVVELTLANGVRVIVEEPTGSVVTVETPGAPSTRHELPRLTEPPTVDMRQALTTAASLFPEYRLVRADLLRQPEGLRYRVVLQGGVELQVDAGDGSVVLAAEPATPTTTPTPTVTPTTRPATPTVAPEPTPSSTPIPATPTPVPEPTAPPAVPATEPPPLPPEPTTPPVPDDDDDAGEEQNAPPDPTIPVNDDPDDAAEEDLAVPEPVEPNDEPGDDDNQTNE
jgi:hypothetical protein